MNNITDVVLVTYNPDMQMLIKCIDSIRRQVRRIWLVDNNSTECDIRAGLIGLCENLYITEIGENKGIAYAQNIGIEKSIVNNARYVLLSDQDTFFPDNYIKQMLALFEGHSGNIAALAPLFHDAVGKDKNEGFVTLSRFGYSRVFPDKGQHQINQAIASGLIIKSSTFNAIGLMNTDLFIDWVDIEWCWRAIAEGYLIIGNADILIEHNLGDSAIKLVHKSINLRGPLRHYYITRNAFYLAIRCEYLDIGHRLNLFFKGVSYLIGYPILAKPRVENFKMTVLGMFHGLVGRLGRLD